ncbi:MAG: hypothetical protein ACTHK7_03680 [Aureliella sp.]
MQHRPPSESGWAHERHKPQGTLRLQTPHLYHLASNRRIDLGHFPSPPAYTGEWRVDTHRSSAPTSAWSASTLHTVIKGGSCM